MHAQNVTSNFITANFSESVDITKNYSELLLLNPTIFFPSDPVSGLQYLKGPNGTLNDQQHQPSLMSMDSCD